MSSRQLKAKQVIEILPSKLSDRPLTIVARQSTTKQVEENTESFKLQIEDARQRFIAKGWSEDIITIRVAGDGKRGVSGTLRIDQRAELIDTIFDIKAGSCKAVGAYSVSRLFRDKYGVQVTTFMQICAEYDVLVITPDKTYDFRNDDDVTMFTFYARFAAIENEQRKRLSRDAKNKKALRGEYDGRFLPPGFIVDRDKKSPTYDRFIEYPPHAQVSRRLYRRHHELGAFNLLASEVAQMQIVFPPFEEWVSPLDIQRFQFAEVCQVHGRLRKDINRKKGVIRGNHCGFAGPQCKLIGYHISKTSLFHLLTAVEYVGYWHVKGELLTDVDGKPLINHTPLIPLDDWEYSFHSLSFHTLDGLPNPHRTHGHSWVPTGKQSQSGALHGILTSPLGSVNCSGGVYRVTEHREGHSQNSDTLVVKLAVIDKLFQERLFDRLAEINRTDLFLAHANKLMKQQAKEISTIPQQITGYEQERKAIQAYIKAVGATADTATLQQYNADLLEISAHIAELEAKQKQAAAKESKLAQLREQLSAMNTVLGVDGSNEHSLGFLRLLCDAIVLDEYSSRFLTLTVRWAVPFERTDVCYIYRPRAARQEWSAEDEHTLCTIYTADRLDIMKAFPTRSWVSIKERATKLGLERPDTRYELTFPYSLSYKDYELLQTHRWELPEEGHASYWLFDVVDNTIETRSRQS